MDNADDDATTTSPSTPASESESPPVTPTAPSEPTVASAPSNVSLTWRGLIDDSDPAESSRRRPIGAAGNVLTSALIALGIMRGRNPDGSLAPRPVKRMVLLFGGAAVVFLVATAGHIVAAGTVSVPVTLGKAGEAFEPGLHFTLPWPLATTRDVSTQSQAYTMSATVGEGQQANVDDSVSVLGSDGAAANIDATVLYKIRPSQAKELLEQIGLDYQSKIVRPSARTCIRQEFTKYPIVSAATSKWNDLQTEITKCMKERVESSGLIVQDFQLREVTLSKEVQSAIDGKVASQQDSERQKFELAVATQRADIVRVNAQATADANQILACGGGIVEVELFGEKRKVIQPNPIDRCSQAQLTPAFLQFTYIQALKELVNSKNTTTLVIPAGTDLNTFVGLNGAATGAAAAGTPTVVTPPAATPPAPVAPPTTAAPGTGAGQ